MQRSELEQQLQILREKHQVFVKRIASLRQQGADREQQLAIVAQQVDADRAAILRAKQQALHTLLQTPPARNGREDKWRLATASLRPLTPLEGSIIQKKKDWFLWLVVFLGGPAEIPVALHHIDIRQLRQQVWYEWERNKAALEHEIEQLSRELSENRETDIQRSLKLEVMQIQRAISDLEQQDELMQIDIKALEQGIASMKAAGQP
jgi:tRNA threonylcarbamoyladenosine modification (KEOPS) complex  Pcc1 subunit